MKTLLLTVLTLGLLVGTAPAAKIATNAMILPDDRLDEVELLEGKISPNDMMRDGQLTVRVLPPMNSKKERPGKTQFFILEGYTDAAPAHSKISVFVWCKSEKVYRYVKLTDAQRKKLGPVRVVGR